MSPLDIALCALCAILAWEWRAARQDFHLMGGLYDEARKAASQAAQATGGQS